MAGREVCTVPSTTCCLTNNPKLNPVPPREGYRTSNCNTLYSDDLDIITPEQDDFIKQQYKGNILQYKANSCNFSQKMIYAKIMQGRWTNRKKCYASQTVTYTNPNTQYFNRAGGLYILLDGTATAFPPTCPQYTNVVNYNSNQRANPATAVIPSGGVFISNEQIDPCSDYIKKNPPSIFCFPTTCSNVPGKERNLCYISRNSCYYPKPKRVMTDVGGGLPINIRGLRCVSANAIPSEARGCS